MATRPWRARLAYSVLGANLTSTSGSSESHADWQP
jgi:hypothetical protein